MRRITTLMEAYSVARHQARGASPAEIQESRDMYAFMDNAMSGLIINQTGGWDGPESKFAEAMTSADFTYALGEFVQRRMKPGYQAKAFNFEPLVANDTLPNYMAVTRYQRQQGIDDLEYTPPGAPPKAGSIADAVKKQYRVYKWQKQYDFLMEALVNDDLGYFADMSQMMGRSARRTLERYVSRFYTNATSIARLVGLGVNYAQTGRMTSTRISEARMGFSQRVDGGGDPMVVNLKYIVHPPAIADTVSQIQASQLVPELATNGVNVIRSSFTPIEDPYMTAPTGAPNWPWYAFADPRMFGVQTFVVARRNGMPAPLLVRKRADMESFTGFSAAGQPLPARMGDFANGAVVVKVWDEWGTYIDETEGNLYDYRGAYYSSGVTP